MEFAYDAERGSDSAGGEGAGVAVGEDVADVSDGVGAVGRHFFVHHDVLVPDGESFVEEGIWRVVEEMVKERFFHAIERPEEVDGSGSSLGEDFLVIEDSRSSFSGIGDIPVVASRRIEGERGGDADGGSAADDHRGDSVGEFVDVAQRDPSFFAGESELIDDVERLLGGVPAEGTDS